MKIRIWHKLALVLILTTTLVIAIAFVLAQISFREDFSGYLKEQEKNQVELLSERLAEGYQEAGSWKFLTERPRLLRLIIRESFRNEHQPFPPPPRKNEIRPSFKPDRNFKAHPMSRYAILDEAKNKVIGSIKKGPSIDDYPIKLNDQIIGYLRIRSVSNFTNKLNRRFIDSQLHSLIGIAILGFILSLIAAWLLSNYFRKRFIQLTDIANDLTAGKFDQRIEVTHDDELSDLGRNFNVLADTLDKNRQAQKRWIADISHELRTPLSILSGEVEALQDGVRPLDQNSINSLANEATHLNRLVNDLYQLSLSDLGKLDYQKSRTDLSDILNRVIDQYQPRLEKQNLTLGILINSEPVFISGDEQRLVQLFSNLLENTIKYTDQNGQVIIACEQDQNNAVVRFEDSSPGIPKENLSKIFDRLYRVENSRNRKTGGAGLGLAIATSIVEAHQGEIIASNSDLGGLKIKIKIPLDKTV
ncbi:MAG: ATP-binding protein [Gammaproteobacteria bacterium]